MENPNLQDIPDYEGLYKFDTNLYKVYNIKTNRYLKNTLTHKGYHQLTLMKNKIGTTFGIHKLVYLVNNPTENINGYVINHIDGNPLNNKIENLRRCSPSDNSSSARTYITNKLGLKYICKTNSGFHFQLVKKGIKYNKHFKKLDEAIKYRDVKVKEINGEYTNLG